MNGLDDLLFSSFFIIKEIPVVEKKSSQRVPDDLARIIAKLKDPNYMALPEKFDEKSWQPGGVSEGRYRRVANMLLDAYGMKKKYPKNQELIKKIKAFKKKFFQNCGKINQEMIKRPAIISMLDRRAIMEIGQRFFPKNVDDFVEIDLSLDSDSELP